MTELVRYTISNNNIHIYNSYTYPKRDFKEIINSIKTENPDYDVVKYRCTCGMCLEWATHNFLYKIGYQRERTADADLDYPQKWYYKIAYPIIGSIAWLFID